MKAQFVIDLLKSNANRFTPAQLEKATGSPRRARRALFLARKAGVNLEAVRDAGRTVTAYVCTDTTLPNVPAKAKAAKAPSAKAAAKAKVPSKKAVAAAHVAAKSVKTKTASQMTPAEIKAKNLETMKKVSAEHKALDSRLTAEQKAIREQFYADEAEIAREEQEAARASVREYLKKEVYAE
jgi:hypothetical protein